MTVYEKESAKERTGYSLLGQANGKELLSAVGRLDGGHCRYSHPSLLNTAATKNEGKDRGPSVATSFEHRRTLDSVGIAHLTTRRCVSTIAKQAIAVCIHPYKA